MIKSIKSIHSMNLLLFLSLSVMALLFLWLMPLNSNHYDLSLYPVIVTFTGVLHMQIGCFMVMNYLCYRKKKYLLPLACAFYSSGAFLFIALYLYYGNQNQDSQLYNSIAILYIIRNILIAGLFFATLYLHHKDRCLQAGSGLVLYAVFIWCAASLALALGYAYSSVPFSFRLVDPDTFEWLFVWRSTLIYLLIVLWAVITAALIRQTRLKDPFWLSMALVAMANLLSLIIMMKYTRVNSAGWYLARGVECFSAMAVMIALMLDIFRRYKASRQAYELSYENSVRDPMTRLFNRGYFYSVLNREIKSIGPQHPLSLIFCDIDHFKSVNDTWGHLQGDRVIIRLAQIMPGAVGHDDLVARIGGEEFAILLPDTDMALARVIAERLRKHVAQASPATTNGDFPRQITISLGIFSSADNSLAAETFANFADRALYMAKNQGRNCVVVYPDESGLQESA